MSAYCILHMFVLLENVIKAGHAIKQKYCLHLNGSPRLTFHSLWPLVSLVLLVSKEEISVFSFEITIEVFK